MIDVQSAFKQLPTWNEFNTDYVIYCLAVLSYLVKPIKLLRLGNENESLSSLAQYVPYL